MNTYSACVKERTSDSSEPGRIPLDPGLVQAGDDGKAYVHHYADTETAKAFAKAIAPIAELPERNRPTSDQPISKGETVMRIAIPIAAGKLAMHFGHCETFALSDVDPKAKKIEKRIDATPPAHAPGVLPKWLAEQKATMIIAGGMGSRAQSLFTENGIDVVVGASSDTPEEIALAYLEGTLKTGGNICDH